MKIKRIIQQFRRDFEAIYKCEHCGYELKSSGYDDEHYHKSVIPGMICPKCKKKAPDNYRPLTTKYPEGFDV